MPLSTDHLRFCSVLGLLILGGCASSTVRGPGDSTVELPQQWREAAQPTAISSTGIEDWWTQLQDPVLNQLIVISLGNSPDIRTALSRIAEARARRGVERSDLLPSIGAGASARASRTHDRYSDSTVESNSAGGSIDASWELDLFGRQRLGIKAAEANLAMTEANYHAAQVSLAAEVALTYVDLRAAEAQLDVVQRNLAIREETTQISLWQEEAGMTDSLNSRQAVASLEQTRASLPSLLQSISVLRNQLAILAGYAPGGFVEPILSGSAGIPGVPGMPDLGIPADTLRQRPDVIAAGLAVESAVAQADIAGRQRLPSLSLSGSIGVSGMEQGDFLSPTYLVSSVGSSLTAPIFQWGRIQENYVIADEQAKQALINYERVVLSALAEVENALVAVRRSAERLEILERAAAAAREAAELATARYETGEADLLVVLEAQRTLLSLEEQLSNTRADRVSAHIQLYKALGGGWSPGTAIAQR